MWCHNALQSRYDPVWVVLTDLSKVCSFASGPQKCCPREAAQTHCRLAEQTRRWFAQSMCHRHLKSGNKYLY